jgi:succinyl-diaminopimelate desuccinylase
MDLPPASGHIAGGWLHGRGSSDSEAGAAIFAHIAARLQDGAGGFGGSVVMLFDVDEHTGGFGGAKAYFEDAGAARGVDSMCQEVVTRSETR